ncbi:MAG: Asp23/Gls24 family envelope stress response protein [Chloroflexi bacterium]|nr:Asp23/Gls24 family envelope stress response protein [Chloroflexota bacterium]
MHLWIVAEGAVALPDLAQRVRSAVAGAVERQLDLVLADVSVVVDGVRG